MWWNGRFASWMCSRQICSNCVMLSCQYGPESLRNVSNTLLNLCHEELRQFWRQKGVQPGTSKVYLIKWPVSVHCNVHFAVYICNIFIVFYILCSLNIIWSCLIWRINYSCGLLLQCNFVLFDAWKFRFWDLSVDGQKWLENIKNIFIFVPKCV